jgi:hypothetical protein
MLCACGLLPPAFPADAAPNHIGVGLVPPSDYNPLKLFADCIKCARGFTVDDFSGTAVAIDARGWPLDDAGVMIWAGAAHMQGTYRLYFTTQNPAVDARTVTLAFAGASVTPQNMAYDAATNTVAYDLAVPDAAALRLFLRNTRGGVKNIRCMRPTATGGTTPYDTSVAFTTRAKDVLGKFQVLRFMHVVNSLSSNMVAEWSQRTQPDYAQQVGIYKVGGGSAGVAWEYLIRLCNEVDADMYANIPFLATDVYIDSLANLFKRSLNPQLKIYLEYSNELWNGVGSYDAHRNIDSAAAEVGRGGSPLNFDSTTSQYYWAWRRAGKRGVEISSIFRRVFGDSAMMTRVRPLLMTQTGNGQATLSQNMIMLFNYYNNPDKVADPHPPSYYFYGAGGAGYFSFSDTATPDLVWSNSTMDTNNYRTRLLPDIAWCSSFGLKRVAYEGGFCYEGSSTDLLNAVWYDDRLRQTTIDHYNMWSRYGGDLFVNFSLTGWDPDDVRAAFFRDIDSLDSPKMRAIDELNASPRAEVEFGSPVPCTIDGDSSTAGFSPLYDPPSRARPTEWYSYVVRIDQAGTYGVTVDVTTTATGALAVYADGMEIGAPALTAGPQTTPKYTAFFEPGLHGFVVRVTGLASGRANIARVNVSVESLIAIARKPAHACDPVALRAGFSGGLLRVTASGGTPGPATLSLCTVQGRIVRRIPLTVPAGGSVTVSLPLIGLGDGLYVVRSGNAVTSIVVGR